MIDETTEAPFDVNDEVLVGDIDQVREERQVLPPTSNVLVKIKSATLTSNANDKTEAPATLKGINCQFVVQEGIEVPVLDEDNNPTGETELKYKNSHLSTMRALDLCIWADPDTKTSRWFKNKQHLVEFQKFCKALDIPLKGISVNDEFLTNLVGRELRLDITREANQSKDIETGEYKDNGTFRNRVRNFKKV